MDGDMLADSLCKVTGDLGNVSIWEKIRRNE